MNRRSGPPPGVYFGAFCGMTRMVDDNEIAEAKAAAPAGGWEHKARLTGERQPAGSALLQRATTLQGEIRQIEREIATLERAELMRIRESFYSARHRPGLEQIRARWAS